LIEEEAVMARVPYREREELPEEYRYLYDNLARGSGRVGNLFRALAHSPRLLLQFMRLGNDLRTRTRLDPRLRRCPFGAGIRPSRTPIGR
jgi:4-carboxymuconolactone decarboxylase